MLSAREVRAVWRIETSLVEDPETLHVGSAADQRRNSPSPDVVVPPTQRHASSGPSDLNRQQLHGVKPKRLSKVGSG